MSQLHTEYPAGDKDFSGHEDFKQNLMPQTKDDSSCFAFDIMQDVSILIKDFL